VSPERKAGEILRTFFTFAAVKIISAQLEGDGRGSLGSFNASSYITLTKFLETHPLRSNSDEWLAKLMEEDELLGARIMEVRVAYANSDFEWDQCQRVAVQDIEKANIAVMRQHAQSRFGGLLAQQEEGDDEGEGEG
jgi:hypothetical protein